MIKYASRPTDQRKVFNSLFSTRFVSVNLFKAVLEFFNTLGFSMKSNTFVFRPKMKSLERKMLQFLLKT